MKSGAASPGEIQYYPYQKYLLTDEDPRVWEYLCFDHYRFNAVVAGYFDLVLKELISASKRKRQDSSKR